MSEPKLIPPSWSGTARPASGLSVTVRTADSADRSLVQAEVDEIPPCSFCGQAAAVDAETSRPGRPWAFMCGRCWPVHGLGVLGTGRGQRLVLRSAAPAQAVPSGSPGSWADAVRAAARRLAGAVGSWVRQAMDPGPVLRADRTRWAGASSLAEVGDLTAQWLTGQLASQPGYYGPVDVDEDLAPGLTAALVALNRAGAVTNGSQAGLVDDDSGDGWVQLAWVYAFVDDALLARLRDAAAGTGYQVIVHAPDGGPVPVTWVRGEVSTSTGWIKSRDVAWLYERVGSVALEQILTAHQISLIDPQPGRNTLWAWLEQAVRGSGGWS